MNRFYVFLKLFTNLTQLSVDWMLLFFVFVFVFSFFTDIFLPSFAYNAIILYFCLFFTEGTNAIFFFLFRTLLIPLTLCFLNFSTILFLPLFDFSFSSKYNAFFTLFDRLNDSFPLLSLFSPPFLFTLYLQWYYFAATTWSSLIYLSPFFFALETPIWHSWMDVS